MTAGRVGKALDKAKRAAKDWSSEGHVICVECGKPRRECAVSECPNR